MATTNKLVDQYGRPIDRAVLSEPQTSRVASLENQYLRPMLDGLTPARLAGTLRDADNGDLIAQHRYWLPAAELPPLQPNPRLGRLLGLVGAHLLRGREGDPPRHAARDAACAQAQRRARVVYAGLQSAYLHDLFLPAFARAGKPVRKRRCKNRAGNARLCGLAKPPPRRIPLPE